MFQNEKDRNRIEILLSPNDIFPSNSRFVYYLGLSTPALSINTRNLKESFCIAGFEKVQLERLGIATVFESFWDAFSARLPNLKKVWEGRTVKKSWKVVQTYHSRADCRIDWWKHFPSPKDREWRHPRHRRHRKRVWIGHGNELEFSSRRICRVDPSPTNQQIRIDQIQGVERELKSRVIEFLRENKLTLGTMKICFSLQSHLGSTW